MIFTILLTFGWLGFVGAVLVRGSNGDLPFIPHCSRRLCVAMTAAEDSIYVYSFIYGLDVICSRVNIFASVREDLRIDVAGVPTLPWEPRRLCYMERNSLRTLFQRV